MEKYKSVEDFEKDGGVLESDRLIYFHSTLTNSFYIIGKVKSCDKTQKFMTIYDERNIIDVNKWSTYVEL